MGRSGTRRKGREEKDRVCVNFFCFYIQKKYLEWLFSRGLSI